MESDSCNNVSACVSVGFYDAIDPETNNWYDEGIIDTLNGGSWQSAVAPVPPDAAKTTDGLTVASFLYSVSCSSSNACTAVGTYQDTDGNTDGLDRHTEQRNVDGDIGIVASQRSSFCRSEYGASQRRVLCDADNCAAVGWYYGGEIGSSDTGYSAIELGLVASEVNGIWVATEATPPSDAQSPLVYDELENVDCPSSGVCFASGSYSSDVRWPSGLDRDHGFERGVVANRIGSYRDGFQGDVNLRSLSCGSATFCATVGQVFTGNIDPRHSREPLERVLVGQPRAVPMNR